MPCSGPSFDASYRLYIRTFSLYCDGCAASQNRTGSISTANPAPAIAQAIGDRRGRAASCAHMSTKYTGIMISDAKIRLWQGRWYELGGATLAMFFLVLAFNLFGDALRDALDPKLRTAEAKTA